MDFPPDFGKKSDLNSGSLQVFPTLRNTKDWEDTYWVAGKSEDLKLTLIAVKGHPAEYLNCPHGMRIVKGVRGISFQFQSTLK